MFTILFLPLLQIVLGAEFYQKNTEAIKAYRLQRLKYSPNDSMRQLRDQASTEQLYPVNSNPTHSSINSATAVSLPQMNSSAYPIAPLIVSSTQTKSQHGSTFSTPAVPNMIDSAQILEDGKYQRLSGNSSYFARPVDVVSVTRQSSSQSTLNAMNSTMTSDLKEFKYANLIRKALTKNLEEMLLSPYFNFKKARNFVKDIYNSYRKINSLNWPAIFCETMAQWKVFGNHDYTTEFFAFYGFLRVIVASGFRQDSLYSETLSSSSSPMLLLIKMLEEIDSSGTSVCDSDTVYQTLLWFYGEYKSKASKNELSAIKFQDVVQKIGHIQYNQPHPPCPEAFHDTYAPHIVSRQNSSTPHSATETQSVQDTQSFQEDSSLDRAQADTDNALVYTQSPLFSNSEVSESNADAYPMQPDNIPEQPQEFNCSFEHQFYQLEYYNQQSQYSQQSYYPDMPPSYYYSSTPIQPPLNCIMAQNLQDPNFMTGMPGNYHTPHVSYPRMPFAYNTTPSADTENYNSDIIYPQSAVEQNDVQAYTSSGIYQAPSLFYCYPIPFEHSSSFPDCGLFDSIQESDVDLSGPPKKRPRFGYKQ